MGAKDEMLEYLWKESTVDMNLVHKCIAAVQLEAVEFFHELGDGLPTQEQANYVIELRKAIGEEE